MYPENTPKRFLAGSGKAIISPKLGTRLYGYPTDRFAATIHDDLTATAIAVSDGTTSAVLISLTLVSIPENICKMAADRIQKATGIQHCIFSATHTHSGPSVNVGSNGVPGWGGGDESYLYDIMLPGVEKAAKDAAESLTEAKLGIGEINTRTGINRRQISEDGTIRLGRNPLGLYDPRMRVITFVTADETKTIGTIIHFGAHGTASGGPYPDSPVTRDWSGVMTDRIEWITGAPCAFLNGAEGDVAPRDFNRAKRVGNKELNHIEQAMEVGGMAAVDASEAFQSIRQYITPTLKIKTCEIKLPYEPLPDAQTAEEKLRELESRDPDDRMAQYKRNRWQKVLEEQDKPKKEAMVYAQTLVQIGPVVFVPHPFEIFTAIAMRLDQFSPVQYTLSLANANGNNGYLPNKEEFPRGGYEIWSSRYRHAYLLTEDADTELIKQNLEFIRQMQEN